MHASSWILITFTAVALNCRLSFQMDTSIDETYKEICGSDWQNKYTNLHQSMISGNNLGKYIISAPFRTGLADILLGYVTAFMISALSDRAYLILRGGYMVENGGLGQTKRHIDYAYHSPNINWTSPEIDQSIYQCLLPPYDHTMPLCSHTNRTLIYGKEFIVKHVHGVNHVLLNTGTNCQTWFNNPNELVLMTNNRGHTLDMLNNTFHGSTLRTDFSFTPDTAFPCMFHYLFRINDDVCTEGCKRTESSLLTHSHSRNASSITIGIHSRRGGAADHFHCADSLIRQFKQQGISVLMVFVSAKRSEQETYKRRYGDTLLLPEGVPTDATLVHQKGFKGDDAVDKKGLMDSARDFHLLSLADIHIVTSRSGFGVVAAMIKLTRKHHIYRIDGRRECSAVAGDPLETLAADWSHLRRI